MNEVHRDFSFPSALSSLKSAMEMKNPSMRASALGF
jgi:hypothetical protein